MAPSVSVILWEAWRDCSRSASLEYDSKGMFGSPLTIERGCGNLVVLRTDAFVASVPFELHKLT